mmetsp:Transcript_33096/g.87373  ORF Transcript_33096/g.87373 Transcript_33096/m.87373 type:complete len:871 (-) Transcript_33096:190-2802(-)|eukprot:CAMPEP_0119496158 /NCGR_PEP_ID=MMETSP1344-20130328/19567_1 /TAXON_ID=236787 /ORGANISM="Florenciella parvula, Strain CCMP2471" /LENGTH=870 /DNA_ID=CAMNT_0007531811 /DNA_START=87 /DNA_END=2699 /DNA_ORIENTATION=-
MDLVQTLLNAQSPDIAVRGPAEQSLTQAADTQPSPFMAALVGELSNAAREQNSRQLAGLYLKNMLTAEDEAIKEQKKERWITAVQAADKTTIRASLLNNLLDANKTVRHTAAQCIGAVAAIDVPRAEWPELVPAFGQVVTSPDLTEDKKESTLEACGYMCEELEVGDLDVNGTNQVLTAIVEGMAAGRPETTRCAAVMALQNALEFCERNFGVDEERNMIMQNVCQACQSPDSKTRVKALECICRIGELYYTHLPAYIEAIYGLTQAAVQHAITNAGEETEEEVGKMAFEFWGVIADEELERGEDADATETNHKFVEQIQQHFLPHVLMAMTKQDDDEQETDGQDLASFAAVCLEKIAEAVGDPIVPPVVQFVGEHIQNADWHMKEAAIMAFGMIVNGPQDTDAFGKIVEQAVPQFLVPLLRDPSVFVKDTTAFTLGRICESCPEAIPAGHLQSVVEHLLLCLDDAPRVALQACTCFHNMAEMCEEIGKGTNWFASVFLALVQKLFGVTERPDSDECELKSTAYEAIAKMIENHPEPARGIVQQMVPEVLARLEKTFETQILSQDDKYQVDRNQALLCATIHMIVRSFDEEQVLPIADQLMEKLLKVLSQRQDTATQEAIMAMGAVADKCGEHFARYLIHVLPFVHQGLQNWEAYQACGQTAGVVGDICRACPAAIAAPEHCDQLMQLLLQDLENPQLNRQVKPGVISVIGDIAMAVEGNFDRYLPNTMPMLIQAASTTMDEDADDEMLEFLDELREAVLDAYAGILNGLEDGKKQHLLLMPTNYVESMINFAELITGDENKDGAVTKGATNMLGDLARVLGKQIAAYFQKPFVALLLQQQHADDVESGLSQADWPSKYANDEIKKLFNP